MALTNTTLPGGYRHDLDGLRALSILLVVAYHAKVDAIGGGYVGVDVFFVISGYLITSLLLAEVASTGRVRVGTFLAKRIRRLLPMAVLVAVTTTLAGLALLPPLSRERMLDDASAALLYVANWRFAFQATDYSAVEVTDGLYLHYWSLSVEEQFYLVWPLLIALIALVARRRGVQARTSIGVTIAIATASSFGASVWLTPTNGSAAYYTTHTRLWEIGVGALAAFVVPRLRIPRRWMAEGMILVGVVAVFASAVTLDDATPFPGWVAVIPVLATTMVIAASAHRQTTLGSLLSLRPLTYVGRLSYGWYLWHWPALGVALLLAQERGAEGLEPGVALAAVVGSFVLAAGTHRWFENPIRHAAVLREDPQRSFAMASALTLVPVALLVLAPSLLSTADEVVTAQNASDSASDDASAVDPMSPREAAADEISVAPGCHAAQASTDLGGDCVVGDPAAERTLLLTGDSHARHWVPALDEWGRNQGWRVVAWSKSSCTPIDVDTWNVSFRREYTECAEWRGARDERITEDLRPEMVVIALSHRYTGVILDPDGRRVEDPELARRLWAEGAMRTLERFSAAADDVVLLHDTPWATEDVPTCLSAAADPAECAVPGPTADELFDAVVAAAPDDVLFHDPSHLICPTFPCSMVTEGGVVKYSDRHHLTQTYSRMLGDAFGAGLTALTTSPSLASD